jgi:hypothetical protein
MARLAGIEPAVQSWPQGTVTCRVLERGSDRVLFVFNHGREAVDAKVELGFQIGRHEVIAGPSPSLKVRGQTIHAYLPQKGVAVLLLSEHPSS